MHRSIAEIQAELDAAVLAARKEQNERYRAFRPEWSITMKIETPDHSFNMIMDPSIITYHLTGTMLNAGAAKDAGVTVETLHQSILFNRASGRAVGMTGGGNIIIGANPTAYEALSAFIRDNPKGGDVSHLSTWGKR